MGEKKEYIYIEEIKNDVWMERKSGKWSGFLKKIKKQTNFQHIFYLFYKKKIINSTKHVFFQNKNCFLEFSFQTQFF